MFWFVFAFRFEKGEIGEEEATFSRASQWWGWYRFLVWGQCWGGRCHGVGWGHSGLCLCLCLCLSTAVRRGKMRSSCVAGRGASSCWPCGCNKTLYQCEHCHKTFLTSASLTSHRLQHTKPFQCEQCNQRFASKGNLVIHRRRHIGEKPFGCHLCDSKFSTKGNLKRHTQTHWY